MKRPELHRPIRPKSTESTERKRAVPTEAVDGIFMALGGLYAITTGRTAPEITDDTITAAAIQPDGNSQDADATASKIPSTV